MTFVSPLIDTDLWVRMTCVWSLLFRNYFLWWHPLSPTERTPGVLHLCLISRIGLWELKVSCSVNYYALFSFRCRAFKYKSYGFVTIWCIGIVLSTNWARTMGEIRLTKNCKLWSIMCESDDLKIWQWSYFKHFNGWHVYVCGVRAFTKKAYKHLKWCACI